MRVCRSLMRCSLVRRSLLGLWALAWLGLAGLLPRALLCQGALRRSRAGPPGRLPYRGGHARAVTGCRAPGAPSRSRRRLPAVGAGVAALALLGGSTAPGAAPGPAVPGLPPAGAAPRPPGSGYGTAPAVRGEIARRVVAGGVVTAARLAALSFGRAGVLHRLEVALGAEVAAGQVLAELDQGALQRALLDAETQLTTARRALAQVQARDLPALAQALDATVAQAQAQLAQAEHRLAGLEAGPDPAELAVAAQELAAAEAAAAAAAARLDALRAGDAARLAQAAAEAEVRALEAQVQAAVARRTALEVAARQTPPPLLGRAVEDELAAAQAALQAAQARLAQLAAPEEAAARRAAEAALQAAQARLAAARAHSARLPAGAPAAEVAAAQAAVAEAEAQLAQAELLAERLRAGDAAAARAQAAAEVLAAQSRLHAAQARRARLLAGEEAAAQAAATQAAAAEEATARAQLSAAQARLHRLAAGSAAAEQQAAAQELAAAQARREAAALRLAQLRRGPPPQARAEARAAVEAARAARAAAQAQAAARYAELGQHPQDLADLADELRRAEARVAALHAEREAGRLLAPFAGRVVALAAAPGTAVTPATPVLVLADPQTLVLHATVPDAVRPLVQPGQPVEVRFPTLGLAPQAGTVAAPPDGGPAGPSGPVVVAPATPLPPAAQTIGIPVEVTIAAGRIPDALLVPRQALQHIAGRTFVEVLEETPSGQRPRAVAVRVGTVDTHHAEILAGLAEGQQVVLRPP